MYFYRETKIGNFSGKDRFSLSKSERITTDAPTGNKLYYNWIRKCYRKFPESAIFAGVTGKKGTLSPCQLVPLSTFPQNPNNNEENNRNYGNRSLFVFLRRKPEGSV